MGILSTYASLVRVSVQAQLQYRASLAMQALGQFMVTGIDLVALAATFARFGSIGGWAFGEAALLYGYADLAFATADAMMQGFDSLHFLIRRGELDRMLLRPAPVFVQLLGHELTLRRAGRLAQGIVALAWGWAATGFAPGALGSLALLLGFAGAVLTFASLVAMQGALAFRTAESIEIVNIVTYGGRYAASYPLSAFKPYLRWFFLFAVPIGCSVYLPMCCALGRAPFPGWPVWLGLVSPLACVPFAALAALAWRASMRWYSSTGS